MHTLATGILALVLEQTHWQLVSAQEYRVGVGSLFGEGCTEVVQSGLGDDTGVA
jgi:hypothetical protein